MELSRSSAVEISAALRQIGKGFIALADAVASGEAEETTEDRHRTVMNEWGANGLTRAEASMLFRKHGFSPQAAGGWVRGDWLEVRPDGLRYLTTRSLSWLAEQTSPTPATGDQR